MKRIYFLVLAFTFGSLSASVVTAQTTTVDPGVEINSVVWATRNVNAPGSFAINPEDAGMFYVWNRELGWSSTDPLTDSDGGTTWIWTNSSPGGLEWAESTNPSPLGWRVPTIDEINTLLDTDKVTNEWTEQNGKNGRKFTDKATGNSIFLPAAGYRSYNGGALESMGVEGRYWSATSACGVCFFARNLEFNSNAIGRSPDSRTNGYSIRCIKSNNTAISDVAIDKSDFNLSANPAGNRLSLSGLQGNETLRIYNIGGSLLYSGQATGETETVSISRLPAGMYFVNIQSKERISTCKFIKK
jgi:uncharacterized protein (TIGR02145 family)